MIKYNLKNIRIMLTEGFDDEELRQFCYDEAQFRPVYNKLAQDTGKSKIIDLLISYSERNLLFDVLLGFVKQFNPARYEKHKPYDSSAMFTLINCIRCEGSGLCVWCKGTGDYGKKIGNETYACPVCHGVKICFACKGRGSEYKLKFVQE